MKIIKYILLVFLFSSSYLLFSQSSKVPYLKVITYNIWNGHDWGKDVDRHDKMVSWIKSKSPDVMALQELCGYTEEKLASDAKQWGHNYSIILKTDGYPVGLTSSKPIELKEKARDGLWHGTLHATTWNIDFFVVHLSPADRDFRFKEAGIILDKINTISNENHMVLGDFNAHSPFDGELDLTFPKLLERKQQSDLKSEKHLNLLDGQHDYSVISKFLSYPLIDVTQRFVKPQDRFTFPGKALIGIWQTAEEVEQNKGRIDFIMTSRALAKKCINVTVENGDDTAYVSDHYPVIAEFEIGN